MNEALVKIDNNLVWDGIKQPFYEVYYLKINDADGQWGLWLRYSFTTPALGSPNGIASLWAIYTEKGGEKIVIRQDYDMGKHDVVHADQFIQIDNSNLSLADCVGSINNDQDSIKWELIFEDPVVSSRLYPHAFLYESSFPPSKIVSPRLLGFVTGTIYVNHKKIKLFRNRVHQGHVFGTAFAPSWTWANCIDFREDTEAYFEGLSARVPLARGKLTRPFSLFSVGMEGERFAANSLIKMAWLNKSDTDFTTWSAAFEKSGYRFECLIHRRPEDVLGLTYDGPNAEKLFCYASLLSDIEIKVFKRRRGSWQDYKLLTARGKCAFETVDTQSRPEIPLLA
jgi:hypothetical protein